MTGIVRGLFVKPRKGAKPVSLESVVIGERGLEGDYHANFANKRQILIMSSNILAELDLEPGELFENVIVEGLDVMALSQGQQLRMGESMVEVTVPCEPCNQMDRIRYGLKEALKDRRGMFVKVVSSGAIRIGDPIEVLCRQSVAENSLK
ncbi:MAG TPA: MOSC domain-containing protein [Terriglobia bacterium]|nr:MOSC domain-containing protein [Terriglobia bacterium]